MMKLLSDQEIQFFKEEGYLIKQQVMDPNLISLARERLWDNASDRMNPTDTGTWIGPIEEHRDDQGNVRGGYSWKYRQIGSQKWIVRMLPRDPTVWSIAEQLLGSGKVVIPDRIRGIYCILPQGDLPEKPTTCHTDGHPFHLGVVGYIGDVPPKGGGFTVWPKSHRKLYFNYHSSHRNEPTDQHEKDIAYFNQQTYVDCHGQAGDIVFWHHRLAHAAGHNRSRQIRQAVLYDFRRKDMDQVMKEPPSQDMWRDWPGITNLRRNVQFDQG